MSCDKSYGVDRAGKPSAPGRERCDLFDFPDADTIPLPEALPPRRNCATTVVRGVNGMTGRPCASPPRRVVSRRRRSWRVRHALGFSSLLARRAPLDGGRVAEQRERLVPQVPQLRQGRKARGACLLDLSLLQIRSRPRRVAEQPEVSDPQRVSPGAHAAPHSLRANTLPLGDPEAVNSIEHDGGRFHYGDAPRAALRC